MYRLMRQMKELSDEKLASYHEAVLDVAGGVFQERKLPLPTVREGETAAEVYLAQAWAALRETSTPSGLEAPVAKTRITQSFERDQTQPLS